MKNMSNAEDILNFWFYEVDRDKWFADEESVDNLLREKFFGDYEKAVRGDYKTWEETPEGALALLLLIDEFPRHMFRNTPRAYEKAGEALRLAREAIVKHFDDRIDRHYKLLFYLPFLNSENEGDQRLSLYYIRERVKDAEWLVRAEKNFETIQRHGRFPDRDAILGRTVD